MSKLSIIIPVYQVDKYLRQCVDSVLSQSLKDIVVYLVDDGSEDESAKICDEYAKKDSRVITIHKLNGGSAAARNTALELVDTPYVTFLDSDDYLSNIFAYEFVIANMIKNDSDICLFAYKRFVDGKSVPKIENNKISVEPKVFEKKDFENWLAKNSDKSHPVIVWNKIYKTAIIKNVRFEKTNLVDDSRFIGSVFEKCNNFLRIDYPFVFYRERLNSQSHGRSIKMCCDHVLSEMTMLDYIVGTDNNELLQKWLFRWVKLFFVDYYEVQKKKFDKLEKHSKHSDYQKTACYNMKTYYNCVYPIIKEKKILPKKISFLCSLFNFSQTLAYYYFCLIKKQIYEG